MLSAALRLFGWLCIVIATSFLVLSIYGSPSYQACITKPKESESSQPQNKGLPHLAVTLWRTSPVRCSGVFIEANRDSLVAVATVVIAIFTITLWGSTYRQVRLSRDEFHATHRPKLRLRYVDAPTPHYNWKPVAKLRLANIGDSGARVVRVGCAIFLRERGGAGADPFDARPKGIEPPILVPVGKECAIDIAGPLGPLKTNDVSRILRGDTDMCLVAIVTYDDRNNIERSTSVFRVWHVKSKRFRRASEDDEYTEWDYED